jgi:hypothetical protein
MYIVTCFKKLVCEVVFVQQLIWNVIGNWLVEAYVRSKRYRLLGILVCYWQ